MCWDLLAIFTKATILFVVQLFVVLIFKSIVLLRVKYIQMHEGP